MNPATSLITAGIGLTMLYTGLLFSWPRIRAEMTRDSLQAFGGLAVLNYVAIPLVTYLFFLQMGPDHSALRLALLTLAVLPCAPLVPAVVTLAGDPPEWSLFVFLGFSLLSLLLIVLLTLFEVQPGHGNTLSVANGLLRYLVVVYTPMLLGLLIGLLRPSWIPRATRVMRPLAGAALLVSVVLFAIAHRVELQVTTGLDLGVMLLFEAFCILAALPLGLRYGGPLLTRLMASGFRNFALAIAFAAIVLDRADVSAYIVVFSAITLPACGLICLLAQLPQSSTLRRRRAQTNASSSPYRKH